MTRKKRTETTGEKAEGIWVEIAIRNLVQWDQN